ncbi:ATP phosphoribosyltransferase regulatory subunit [Candidatus Nitrospira bockiana]
MATILPHTAQRVRHLEETLLATLSQWGYQEIIPPTFEYLDVVQAGLEPDLIEKCYKFSDRTTGRILLLRPDVTAQIARIVAMGMVGTDLPLRLCYRTTVFRYEPEHAGREREIFQVGAELIGADDVAADAEILALMAECLRRLGLEEFKISVGHVGFFKALLAKSGLSEEGQKRAEQAAARKDLPRLEEILQEERVNRTQAGAILETVGLYGREEVLARGRAFAGQDRDLRPAVDRLADVYDLLSRSELRAHLLLDLGEFRGFDYYDGLVFEVFAKGVGYEIGGGGRYNHLIGRFGRDLPSTGFAFDVDRLFRAMEDVEAEAPEKAPHFYVSAPPKHQDQVFETGRVLRQAGYRVIQACRTDGADAVLAEGARVGAEVVVLLGVAGVAADEALVAMVHAEGPAARPSKSKLKDLPSLIRR